LSPAYQFNIGDVIETHDNRYGMIIDRTNAHNYMAFHKGVTDKTIQSYMHIAIYKVLIDSSITYVNESNIRGVVE
tara:strand:- start:654 stop:878 length:225 start_codon:yes stop_codon:yes gene_type:complete